jgi:predicted TIM-barrel fold metal-dependent hydrolase
MRNTLAYRNMLRELRSFFGTAESEEEILAERDRRMKQSYKQYALDLLGDANIETLIVDVGYKPAEVSPEAFEALVPVDVRYVYRIETVLDETWQQKLPLPQAEERVFEALEQAFTTPRLVAIKQLIGYRTGLRVEDVKRTSLMKGDPSEKQFRDYFFLRTTEKAIERGYPIQIHTGFGESNIDMSTNNPLLLKGFLEHPKYRGARIILLHGSYPYSFEAGFIVNVFPNVYIDLSAMNLFSPPYVFRDGMEKIFNLCPFNKAMYGSDGGRIPDTHWLAAKVARRELSRLFTSYVEDGLFDEAYAMTAARMVLSETAKRVYGLSS